jgi:aryl-alcohol dehydrogenase-like predicted oxidoreductase
MDNSRRNFVKAAAAAGVAGNLPVGAAGELPKRALGKTGLQVSIVGLGGARIGNLPNEQPAVDVVRRCFDLGVNYFDAAAAGAYGLSQVRYGLALRGMRDKVVLATKTRHRTYSQAQLDLRQSLANLKTDYLDLYQIHNVGNDEDIEFIFGPKGVMELIEKMKKEGTIRFVGVTGHDPLVLNKIISRYPFDTVLMPLSVTDGANEDPRRSCEKTTLPVARQKGMGIIAMKVFGAGAILEKKVATAGEALGYALSLPVSTAILGCNELAQVEQDIAAARNAKPLSAAALDGLRRRVGRQALARLEPWKNGIRERPDVPVYWSD